MDQHISVIFLLVLLTGLSRGQGQGQDGGNVEDLIDQVFNNGGGGGTQTGDRGGVSPDEHGTDECICVPYFMCDPENNTIITDGKSDGFGVIDIRFGQQQCSHYLEVCCKPSKTRPPIPTTVTPPITDIPIEPTPTPTPIPIPPQCGIRNVNGVSFHITGDTDGEAQFAEFPWMVELLWKNWVPSREKEVQAICAGSLIHPQVILTGAHCVHKVNPAEIIIRAGEWDTQTTNEILPFQERSVVQIVSHPEFNAKTLNNDIALLILDSPVHYADNVATICLPEPGVVSTSHECFASGWGKTSFGKNGTYQVILKKIELPMVPNPQCQVALRKTRLGHRFTLHNSFVCAGGEAGKDVCKGDGGGPLVCPRHNNKYEQTGIVAWGIGCGDQEVPGVYSNVALFRNWIDQHMNSNGFGIESYTQ